MATTKNLTTAAPQNNSGQLTRIAAPHAGDSLALSATLGMKLDCDFDTSKATFTRIANDLVMDVDGGGRVIINNFFVSNGSPLPTFILENGFVVAGEVFLKNTTPQMDLNTASPVQVLGSGVGAYEDAATDLLGGVQRLGSTNVQQSASASTAPIFTSANSGSRFLDTQDHSSAAPAKAELTALPSPATPLSPAAPLSPAEPTLVVGATESTHPTKPIISVKPTKPIAPVEPAKPIEPGSIHEVVVIGPEFIIDPKMGMDRFVLNTGAVATAINGKAIAGSILLNDFGGATNTLVSVTEGTYGTAVCDPVTGAITYTLRSHAASLMEAGTADVIDTITYTALDAHGVEYQKNIEVVIVRGSGSALFTAPDNVDMTFASQIALAGSVTAGINNDTITVATLANAGTNIAINAGAGNDVISLTASAAGGVGLKDSTIDLGTGADYVAINANALDNATRAMVGGSIDGTADNIGDTYVISATGDSMKGGWGLSGTAINAGGGDDSINISATKYAVYAATINTGAGNDSLTLSAIRYSGPVSSFQSNINMGDGDDSFSAIGGQVHSTTLAMGEGENTINILAEQPVRLSTFTSGAGNDLVSIRSNDGHDSFYNSTFNAGDGDNTLSFISLGANKLNTASGGVEATILTGSGKDYLDISINGPAVYNSSISTGANDDTISIINTGNVSYVNNLGVTVIINPDNLDTNATLYASTLDAGTGNDLLSLTNVATGNNSALLRNQSTILGGEGNDSIHLDAGHYFSHVATAGTVNTVNGGEGDDLIMFHSSTGKGTMYDASLVVDGGNNAPIQHAASGGESHLGDIIGFGDNLVHQIGSLSAPTTHNFEALLTNYGMHPQQTLAGSILTNTADAVDLDTLLSAVSILNQNGNNQVESLVIKLDGNDSINFGMHTPTAQEDNVALHGVEGTFKSYTINNEGIEIHVYVQTMLTV